MDNKPLKEIINEEIRKWSKDSSYHGVPKIVSDKNKLRRFMWGFFFLISICGCIYVTTISLNDFYKYKKSVSIHHHEDMHTVLPAITICNMNPFNVNH